jgi:hypothetical protein
MHGGPGLPERQSAGLRRGMIARRRHIGVLVPDVPEYLVDNDSIGDKRDDSHGPPAAGTEERIILPDLPDELCPSNAPAPALFVILAERAIGCLVRARRPALPQRLALSRGVRVEAVRVHEALVGLGDVDREA